LRLDAVRRLWQRLVTQGESALQMNRELVGWKLRMVPAGAGNQSSIFFLIPDGQK
jgi:hypothetical protein